MIQPLGLYRRFTSRIDGTTPILVLISLGRSRNRKTGSCIQVSVVCESPAPHHATKSGADFAVCGNCKYRPLEPPEPGTKKRYCYVQVAQAPRSQWDAYQRGKYEPLDFARHRVLLSGVIRATAYGDPTAVPIKFWRELMSCAAGFTAYTHGWRTNPDYRDIFVASVDSPEEAREASALGWRYFRVRAHVDEPLASGEVICPADSAVQQRTQCVFCQLCRGGRKGRNPVVVLHGPRNRNAA